MAEVNVYVDPDATGGGTGVDWTNAYTSLSAAEAAEQTDLVTDGDYIIFHCRASSGTADPTNVSIDGWTTGSSNYVKIIVDEANRHEGTWTTGKYRLEAANAAHGVIIAEDNVRIEGLQAILNHSNNYIHTIYITATGVCDIRISKCILRANASYIHRCLYLVGVSSAGSEFRFWNNLCYDAGQTDSNYYNLWIRNATNLSAYVYNNTIISGYRGFRADDATVYAKNNVAFNNPDSAFTGTGFDASSTNNAYGSSTDPGSNGIDLSGEAGTDLFTDYNNDDFSVKDVDSAIYRVGADLDSDSDLAVTDDIIGTSRHATTPDIGAFEFVSGAPAADIVILRRRIEGI